MLQVSQPLPVNTKETRCGAPLVATPTSALWMSRWSRADDPTHEQPQPMARVINRNTHHFWFAQLEVTDADEATGKSLEAAILPHVADEVQEELYSPPPRLRSTNNRYSLEHGKRKSIPRYMQRKTAAMRNQAPKRHMGQHGREKNSSWADVVRTLNNSSCSDFADDACVRLRASVCACVLTGPRLYRSRSDFGTDLEGGSCTTFGVFLEKPQLVSQDETQQLL